MASKDFGNDKRPEATDAKDPKSSIPQVDVTPVINKEKLARHDMQHHKDMELAAMLQASWAARVQTEHMQ